ncbi:hypothetical protein LSCM1_01512 [Leishmania martiniquensis]|uniref:CorA-like Mg2+ transporter family protein n=1 Tax=Leishmania martiniquensis TaxID=1580590 RepID=A0A836KCL7_9TRYP|nr:hypothetical protein LSCM1_01512 [Leishmania martiniquensis]
MASAVHIPCARQESSIFSQQNRDREQPVPPISESMVRERLSVNLPDSFHYLSNTQATGRGRGPLSRQSRLRSSSSSASSDSSTAFPGRAERNDPGGERRSRPPHASTRDSSSSSSSGRRSIPSPSAGGEKFAFHARLAKIGRGGHGGECVAVAQCCDTVRSTLRLLEQEQLCTGDSNNGADFFWLDLHGVPPPRQRRRERGALRGVDSGDAPMSALWDALGLQASTAHSFTAVCKERQAHPQPNRTALDDVYEEEVVGLSYPADRVLQVEPLQAPGDAEAVMGECDSDHYPEERVEWRREREATVKRAPPAGADGSAHYVALELATLLSSMPLSATALSEEVWASALLPRAPSVTKYRNEPLNDLEWPEGFGRSVLGFPAAAAATNGAAAHMPTASIRQVAQLPLHSQEPATTPLITSTYVVCLPTGCVTWCPASTLGLTSTNRRAAAAEARRRWRRSAHAHGKNAQAEGGSGDALSADEDYCAEVQCVKLWEQLQTSVLSRMQHMAQLSRSAAVSSNARSCSASGELSGLWVDAPAGPLLSTPIFLSLLLSSVCYAYLPNTARVLGEVDAIDSMLPLIDLDCESDQADALRRALLLRRHLALHRRLLFQKASLLEALDRPTMHTVARFVQSPKAEVWAARGPALGIVEEHRRSGTRSSATGGGRSDPVSVIHVESPRANAREELMSDLGSNRKTTDDLNMKGLQRTASPDRSSSCHKAQRLVWGMASPPESMAAPPSLHALHKSLVSVLRHLEVARTVLGSTTLIYTSKVNFTNSRTSERADYFALVCQYVLLVMLPLNIVASHWGMNCPVPFMNVEGTTPFWGIVGVIAFIGVVGLIFPIYAYRTRKIYLIS